MMALFCIRSLILLVFLLSSLCFSSASAKEENYNDERCKCICPNPNIVNGSSSNRKLYIANVEPNRCNCDRVVLPELPSNFSKGGEFCLHCECKYENRNTTTIKVVIVFVICIISLLVVYMTFLSCFEPIINQRSASANYQHQNNDEDEDVFGRCVRPLNERGGVLNRVGHRQNRWKQQVEQQRDNIYIRHSMLN